MYKKMLEEATAKGVANEKTMWASVTAVDGLLAKLEDAHPDVYWDFIRDQHELIYGGHYSEDFADYDVAQLKWNDKEGKEHDGAHWTKEQVKSVTAGKSFPAGTTEYDKWVAYNSMYSDLSNDFDEDHILKAAYSIYFADYDFDYTKGGKIWKVMRGVR